ncbi:MAG: LysR family transcriptional regulator [Gammaproteobacteria bacterium]|nr:LysR family transcriptional regulator [Gammaproteobacteria bacterium]
MDRLTSMKVFATVARLGSFSAAAEELGISKAMASKHLNHLENSLGIRLLNRTTRHLSLTEVGMAYRERINSILVDIEDTELAVTRLHSEPRGTLRIMAPPSFGSFHLARTITAYKDKYPNVMIEMILADRTPDLIEEGLDMAIHVGEMNDTSLIARKLTSTRRVVCGSPKYLQLKGIPEVPADLKNHNCLTFSHHSSFTEWKFKINGTETTVHTTGNLKSNVADPLRIAAIEGCGLVQLPTYMLGLDIQSGQLRPVLEKYEPVELPIYAIYAHRKHLSTKLRTFVDFIYELFQPTPYWDEWISGN